MGSVKKKGFYGLDGCLNKCYNTFAKLCGCSVKTEHFSEKKLQQKK